MTRTRKRNDDGAGKDAKTWGGETEEDEKIEGLDSRTRRKRKTVGTSDEDGEESEE